MKILTFAIPCYNSAAYMSKCIESLLPAGDDVEILVINDGSTKDNTSEIAKEYENRYPGIVRAIDQENKGHGGAVNTGIRNATGLYFKVIDSDDWADQNALLQVVAKLKELEYAGTPVDMFLANFIYDKDGARRKKVMSFRHVFPIDEVFGWSAMRRMKATQYILMHNIFFRMSTLKRSGLVLPEHMFYVDNIFAFQPYPYVNSIYYMDVNFYHYYIGREDQSVNEQVMISRIDQQIAVNRIMIDIMTSQDFRKKDPHVRKVMLVYLDKIMGVTSALCLVSGTEENLAKKKEIWLYLRKKSRRIYRKLRWTTMGLTLNLPGRLGRKTSVRGYKIARRLVGFN